MFGGGNNNNKSSSNVTGSTCTSSGMTASTMAHLPLVLPSPKHGENSGPLRRRLHAVDTLNLPPVTPGSNAAASNRGRYSATTMTTTTKSSGSACSSKGASTPSTPSQIGEIIFGGGMGAASPAPSQVTLSTIGTNGTPVSRSTMRDLLDTLNSLEGGGDDVSSFGGSIGQSTIASKYQSPAQAPRSVTSSSSSSSSSRPPRALNIPARNIGSVQRDGSSVGAPPSGIPRPASASTANTGCMPPIHQKRETRTHPTIGGDISGPRLVTRNKNASTSKSKVTSKEKTKGFQIPTIAQEVEADSQVATTRAPPQSVMADNNRKENAYAGVHASKLPPMNAMKGRNRAPKSQGKQSGAFPTTFGSAMSLNSNENVVMPMTASSKSRQSGRVKSTKIYTRARSSNQQMQMQQKLPSLHLPPTNNQRRQHPDAVLPGSRKNYVGGNMHNVGNLAEF